MAPTLLPLYLLLTFVTAYILYRVLKRVYRIYNSSLRLIPGPPSLGFFYGSVSQVLEADAYRLFDRWTSQWGPTFKYSSMFNANKLYTADVGALAHILSSDIYVKSNIMTQFSPAFSVHMNRGLLFVEGTRHRQLRKIMASAFSYSQIREFTHVFLSKSLELRDLWSRELSQSKRGDNKLEIDAFVWMNRLALDTIGLAAFDYDFDSLHTIAAAAARPNELLKAVRDLFTFDFFTVMFIVQLFFPLTRLIPTAHSRTTAKAVATIRRIGNDMITQKKSIMLAQTSWAVSKQQLEGADLLSLLVKSTLATDIPAEERMTDEEILSQIPSVLVAGHETSAATVTWTLFSLATNPEVQAKLRSELQAVDSEKLTMSTLLELPYLDAVLRESLRLNAPVGFTQRTATKTDYIPLQTSYVDLKGTLQNTVRVGKGDKVKIPIRAVNRSKDLWGFDAEEFKPERWLDNSIPQAVKAIPAVWGNTMSFLAGPHACIGYRVALVQMKAMLFTLVRDFVFELAISPEDVGRRENIVGRPYVASDPGAGFQLPMLISSRSADS
ncbi:cytochrome P450 [Roridomyces roridus]|uniref:Cytochrome P450 n=1 Tax=Roridomyces roridus TaxID=1738132 RepID=A0AAD7C7S4_9AGAR|nr:cytochrome P450 [Roridomyces roridus]